MIHVTPEEFFGTDHVVELPMEDEYMNEEYITLKRFAAKTGMDRSAARKYILKHGYIPKKLRTMESGGQWESVITKKEAAEIIEKRKAEFVPGY